MSQSRDDKQADENEVLSYSLKTLGMKPDDLKEAGNQLNEFARANQLARATKFNSRTTDVSDLFTDNFLLTSKTSLGPLQFLIDNMQTLEKANFDTIFIDILPYLFQLDFDEYFKSGKFPNELKDDLNGMDTGYTELLAGDGLALHQVYNFMNLFEKARAAKIRIVGLYNGLKNISEGSNLLALKIIEKEKSGKKWCGLFQPVCLSKKVSLVEEDKSVANLAEASQTRFVVIDYLDPSSIKSSTNSQIQTPEIRIHGVTWVKDNNSENYIRHITIDFLGSDNRKYIMTTPAMLIRFFPVQGAAVLAVPELKQSISQETKNISDAIALSTGFPSPLINIVEQFITPAEYVQASVDSSPESVAAYCLKLFKSDTQNGVSCALNQLPHQRRTDLLNVWLDKYLKDADLSVREKYLLLIFYYSDPSEWCEIKEINPSRIHEAIKNSEAKNAEDKNVQVLPPAFLHAVKIKLNFYERKFMYSNQESINVLKQTQQLLAQSTLHLNFRGIKYDWIDHLRLLLLRKIIVDHRFVEGYDFSTLDFTNARLNFVESFAHLRTLDTQTYNFREADFTNANIKGAYHCDFSDCLFRNTFIQGNLTGSLVNNATFIKCKIKFNRGNVPDFRTAHYDSNLIGDLHSAILTTLDRVGSHTFIKGVHEHSLLYIVCKKIQKNFVGYNLDKDLFEKHMKSMTDQDILLLAYGTGIEDEELSKRINDIKVDQYLQLSKLVQESIKIIMTPEKLKELSDALPKPAPKKKLDPLGSLGDQLITLFDSKQPTKKESKADHLNPKPSGKK